MDSNVGGGRWQYIGQPGAGTALDFALQLVEQLYGVVKREEVGAPWC